ncbi:MAG: hypothetical protein HKM04_02670 [Legionellales bacterium]|nr:hypothetical protein [Legionellales bacterium]
MSKPLSDLLVQSLTNWLMKEKPGDAMPLSDFERLRYEIRPCDVLLVEGLSRVSDVIRVITQSPWTHSMLYIGRLHDIENLMLRERVREAYTGDESEQLVVEGLLGKGTIVTPLSHYEHSHIRICRPKGISRVDSQKVIGYAIGKIGVEYDVRQVLDLARLLIPWNFLPRHWRSSLFQHKAGEATRQICSSLLAEAFNSVHFPILPVLHRTENEQFELVQRNPRLFTPSDFDYSPFFEIIKYPFFSLSEDGMYRHLPWAENELSNDDRGISKIGEKPAIPAQENTATSTEQETTKATEQPLEVTPPIALATQRKWFRRHKPPEDDTM